MVVLMVCLALWAVSAPAEEGAAKPAGVRVGIYDSRAIAVAFVGSEVWKTSTGRQLAAIKTEYDEAKAQGNQQRVKELEAEGKARQALLHNQGFGTTPVDDILKHIGDKMPEITKAAGVGPIASKWDKAALAKYESAEKVDITMALVNAFHPTDRQLKFAIDIQKRPPVGVTGE
jgi:hypothetical protein